MIGNQSTAVEAKTVKSPRMYARRRVLFFAENLIESYADDKPRQLANLFNTKNIHRMTIIHFYSYMQ